MTISNQRLIQLLNSFTEKELEQFRIFISSPIFTKGRNYLNYLDHILEIKDKYEKSEKPEKSKSKSKTGNAESELSDQTFRNRCSELNKLGEEFLIYLGLNEDKTEKNKILLRKLNEKKLHKAFKSNYEKTLSLIGHEKFDINKLKKLTKLSDILSDFFINRNKVDKLYSEFYEYSKLVLCQNLLELFQMGYEFNQLEINNRTFEPNYVTEYLKSLAIDETMQEFGKSDQIVFKVTAMNFYLFKAFDKDTSGKLYSESHKIFSELSADLKESYRINIFKCMTNLCIYKLNSGETDYRLKLFELYNEKLSQNLTSDLEVNSYDFNHFRDYVYIGISLKKHNWVENFIIKYSVNLPPEMRNSETKLSFAKLEFEKKNFHRSLENLYEVKATHYLQYIDTSLLKLCNYYELEKYEEALLEIDKQNHYIKNHKEIPMVQYKYVVNFIKILKLLIRKSTEPYNKDKGIIEAEYRKLKHIAKRIWLEEKISGVKK